MELQEAQLGAQQVASGGEFEGLPTRLLLVAVAKAHVEQRQRHPQRVRVGRVVIFEWSAACGVSPFAYQQAPQRMLARRPLWVSDGNSEAVGVARLFGLGGHFCSHGSRTGGQRRQIGVALLPKELNSIWSACRIQQ